MGISKDPEAGEEGVVDGVPAYYGTFQGQANYPQPSAPSGSYQGQANYPQPSAPSGSYQGQPVPPSEAPHYASSNQSYQYQSVGGSRQRVMEGRPLLGGEHYQREDKLPCCNLGYGWFLFILGFFFVIPWYIGTFMYFCVAHDYRERTGLMACAIASLIAVVLGVGGGRAGGAI